MKFAAKINFQTETTPTVPPGYRADIGRAFGLRANGLTYGWDAPNESEARDQDSPLSPDERYDTFNHLSVDGRWAIAVPNGTYRVRIVAGDPRHFDSVFKINAEGVRVVDGAATLDNRFVEGSALVEVADGNIGIRSALGAVNNKLAFVEIESVSHPQVTWYDDNGDYPSVIGRVEAASVQIGSKLYVMGGFSDDVLGVTSRVDILDFDTGQWTSGAPLPMSQTHAGVTTDGRYIYWIAGQVGGGLGPGTKTSWRYDTVTNTWDRYVDAPGVRYAPGLACVDGILYLFGGDDATRSHATIDTFALNTRSKNPSWVRLAPLPLAIDHHGVAIVNGTIYAIGGEDSHGVNYNQYKTLFAYDRAADTWTRKADLPTASSHFEGGVHVVGDKILAVGGRVGFGSFHSNEVRVYDTVADEWTVLAPLPTRRLGPISAMIGDAIWVSAGYSPELGITTQSYWGLLDGF